MALFTRDFIANILLHVGFMSALIGAFFFTYGAYVEKQITTTQIEEVVDGYFASYALVASPQQKMLLGALIAPLLSPPDFTKEDAQVAEANKKLMVKAGVALGALLVATVALAFFVSRQTFVALLKENVAIVVAVAVTEFCFLTFIAAKYKAIDPNYLKLTVVKALQTVQQDPTVHPLSSNDLQDLLLSLQTQNVPADSLNELKSMIF